MTPDKLTREWIRNAADEKAAANGCRFDEERGEFVVKWIEHFCRLYEGCPGTPMKLGDWQLEATMRIFGWVVWSEHWKQEVRRFREASIFIAKKNGKSPTLAAWGLYLLCGDGEPGQKVFLAAKDGKQARGIAGEHLLAMRDQSPELKAETTINRTTMRISHTASRSFLEPLSSSNVRTQESKEGLNGSVLIDEVHVVDRAFVDRISRAGISRMEPLQIEVSTAGNDPDSYGFERFKYAQDVEAGRIENQALFTSIYAAPQDLSDEDLAKDPLKYGRMANPAMGRLVNQEEYLADYAKSKHTITKLATFKMYRLNIWQRAAQPWLKMGDWLQCRKDFPDLAGRACFAGLDLSKTQDMTSLVLVFPADEDGEFYLLPFFWLPEDCVNAIGQPVMFKQWAHDGLIEVTPGDVIDYRFIKRRWLELCGQYQIQELAFDPRFAEQTTQEMEEESGVPRFAFGQTINNYTEATSEFERLVVSGKVHHNGNSVLTWQAGHVTVRQHPSGGLLPVKPPREDKRKIDGIIAGIMGLARAMANPVTVPHVEVW